MKMNANITMSTAIVQGPRLIVTVIWNIDQAVFDTRLQANNTTVADLTLKMDVATKNSVCSLDVMAAFVRLGGQVQYTYRTLDGFIVLSPLVAACHRDATGPPLISPKVFRPSHASVSLAFPLSAGSSCRDAPFWSHPVF